MEQDLKAQHFRAWHSGNELCVLPCAWDVASARVFEVEGYKAVGTTSLGVAASLGYGDGQRMDFQELLTVVRKIVSHVRVPVSVDVEAGYATTVEAVAGNMHEVIRAGAVGVNIEDENHSRTGGLVLEPVRHMLEKIKAVRAMSEAVGLSLFINAKTDAVWLGAGEDAEAVFREAVDRANAYGDAGADCVFIPGDFDRDALVRLIGALRHPLNIVIKESTPPIQVLREIGVRRLSMGSGPMRSAMGHTRRLAREILDSGTYRTCLEGAIPFAEAREGFQGER